MDRKFKEFLAEKSISKKTYMDIYKAQDVFSRTFNEDIKEVTPTIKEGKLSSLVIDLPNNKKLDF